MFSFVLRSYQISEIDFLIIGNIRFKNTQKQKSQEAKSRNISIGFHKVSSGSYQFTEWFFIFLSFFFSFVPKCSTIFSEVRIIWIIIFKRENSLYDILKKGSSFFVVSFRWILGRFFFLQDLSRSFEKTMLNLDKTCSKGSRVSGKIGFGFSPFWKRKCKRFHIFFNYDVFFFFLQENSNLWGFHR